MIGAFYILNVATTIFSDSLAAILGADFMGMNGVSSGFLALQTGPAALWAGLLAITVLVNIWLTIGMLRHFVNRRFDGIDRSLLTENLTMPALNFIAGSILFMILVGIGTVLLIVPGIYLLVSLIFWSIFVAVEDDTFIDALKNSWDLTKGNKIDMFLIGLGIFLLGLLASAILGVPNILLMSVNQAAGVLVSQIANAFGTVLGMATLAHAYNELQ